MKTNILTTILLALLVLIVVPAAWLLFLGPQGNEEPTATAEVELVTPSPEIFEITIDETARILEANSEVYYQINGRDSETAKTGDDIPAGPNVRTWTASSTAQLQFSDGTVISLDENTALALYNNSSINESNTGITLSLEGGKILVLSTEAWVRSMNGAFQAWTDGATMGITHDASKGSFQVHCLGPEGKCYIQGLRGFFELQPGIQRGYINYNLGATQPVDPNLWQIPAGVSLPQVEANTTPDITVTATATNTPTDTPTPTATIPFVPTKEKKDKDDDDEPIFYSGAIISDDNINMSGSRISYQLQDILYKGTAGWFGSIFLVLLFIVGLSFILPSIHKVYLKNLQKRSWKRFGPSKDLNSLYNSIHEKDSQQSYKMSGD